MPAVRCSFGAGRVARIQADSRHILLSKNRINKKLIITVVMNSDGDERVHNTGRPISI